MKTVIGVGEISVPRKDKALQVYDSAHTLAERNRKAHVLFTVRNGLSIPQVSSWGGPSLR